MGSTEPRAELHSIKSCNELVDPSGDKVFPKSDSRSSSTLATPVGVVGEPHCKKRYNYYLMNELSNEPHTAKFCRVILLKIRFFPVLCLQPKF